MSSLLTGRRLGVYHLQERIGAGGMGEVYRARDTKLGRDVGEQILALVLELVEGETLAERIALVGGVRRAFPRFLVSANIHPVDPRGSRV